MTDLLTRLEELACKMEEGATAQSPAGLYWSVRLRDLIAEERGKAGVATDWPLCSEPGCKEHSTCGVPSVSGYRHLCARHAPMREETDLDEAVDDLRSALREAGVWDGMVEAAFAKCKVALLAPDPLLLRAREALDSAYWACYNEYMACPWCSGHVGCGNERHDEFCTLSKLLAAIDARIKGGEG